MYKKIVHWWHRRRERFYRRNRWHLALDTSLVILVLLLAGVSLRLALYHPVVLDILNLQNSGPTSTDGILSNKLELDIQAAPEKTVVKLDDRLIIKIDYHNQGSLDIDQAIFSLDFTSAAFQIKNLKVTGERAVLEQGQIVLNDIKAGAQGSLELEFDWLTVKSDFPRNLELKLIAELTSAGKKKEKEISLPQIKIASDLEIKAGIYYHSPQGDQLGIGPLPPVVGIPTKYWLIVKALNSGNALENLVFSARLPEGVSLSDEQSLLAGKFSYNQQSRRLIWQVDNLSAAGGDYIANFALTLMPSEEQIGKNAPLLYDLQYHVDDTWTGLEISSSLSDLDSSLPDDRLNRNHGEVVAQ
jgi:hypothetical protein